MNLSKLVALISMLIMIEMMQDKMEEDEAFKTAIEDAASELEVFVKENT